MRTLEHCKVTETSDWDKCVIYFNGVKSTSAWIEVNATEGWGIKYSEPLECIGEVVKTERVVGNFVIRVLMIFKIHLEYAAETISEAQEKMRDVTDELSAFPDSICLVFSDPDDQDEYEQILMKEGYLGEPI